MSDLSNYRKSYEKSALTEAMLPEHPLELFTKWFGELEQSGSVEEPNAMTVSTIGADGFPRSRVVLLKGFNDAGFIFFTNYQSEKGKALAENPNACVSFFWPALERQVIIKGTAEKVSPEASDLYFNSRPLGSRIGAVVSPQSEIIPSREYLESKLEELEMSPDRVKRPDHWGGYIIRPVEIEFWQGRANRLHDRIRYKICGNRWRWNRLAP